MDRIEDERPKDESNGGSWFAQAAEYMFAPSKQEQ